MSNFQKEPSKNKINPYEVNSQIKMFKHKRGASLYKTTNKTH